MTTATWNTPDSSTQTSTEYKANIDADMAIIRRLQQFTVHQHPTANMRVAIDAGAVFSVDANTMESTITEIAATTTSVFANVSSGNRIDRIVIGTQNGTVSIVQGTANSATPPPVPLGYSPLARVALTANVTAITNGMITDERIQPLPINSSGSFVYYASSDVTGAANATFNVPYGFKKVELSLDSCSFNGTGNYALHLININNNVESVYGGSVYSTVGTTSANVLGNVITGNTAMLLTCNAPVAAAAMGGKIEIVATYAPFSAMVFSINSDLFRTNGVAQHHESGGRAELVLGNNVSDGTRIVVNSDNASAGFDVGSIRLAVTY